MFEVIFYKDEKGHSPVNEYRNRVLYCFHRRTQVILLHAFLKRTDDIPQKEIEIALKRKADYLEREALL